MWLVARMSLGRHLADGHRTPGDDSWCSGKSEAAARRGVCGCRAHAGAVGCTVSECSMVTDACSWSLRALLPDRANDFHCSAGCALKGSHGMLAGFHRKSAGQHPSLSRAIANHAIQIIPLHQSYSPRTGW